MLSARDSDGTPLLSFNLEALTPSLWIRLLTAQPQFAARCRKWKEFTGQDWARLLVAQPQLATRCDFRKLDGNDWGELLEFQPQLANSDAWTLMADEPHEVFFSPLVRVLYNHPELGERTDLDLSKLSQQGKRMLLSRIPSLADRGLIKLDEFPPEEWFRLITVTPSPAYMEKCPFGKMNPVEIAIILHDQPQLRAVIREQVPKPALHLADAISNDSLRVLMISDLFWHLDDARMSRNLAKLIIVLANISWMYFVLGLSRQSRRYLDSLRLCIRKNNHVLGKNPEYALSDPAEVLPSLETMIDLQESYSLPPDLPEKLDRKTAIFIRRFKRSSIADPVLKSLKKAIRGKLKKFISLEDSTDFASPKMCRRVKDMQTRGMRVALLNIEERIARFFSDPKKKQQVADFHKTVRFFSPASKDNMKFDKVVSIPPMLFGRPSADIGDRILSAIFGDYISTR